MKAFIALGSNLGDREANIRQALQNVEQLPETTIVRGSSLYDTEPVGMPDQPNFLNGVVQIETHLAPRQLLWNLMLIERRLGRVRTQHWGPRVIDLDLLLYGDEVIDEDDLQVVAYAHVRLIVSVLLLRRGPRDARSCGVSRSAP